MSGKQAKRNIPKRASNENLKRRRRASWEEGEKRKRLRKEKQAERERANRALRKEGLPTPWEEAKTKRHDRRHPKEGE